MILGTIYTLYGRRAGAELYVEKILQLFQENGTFSRIYVFCNREVYELHLWSQYPQIQAIYIKYLDNQIMKSIWLNYLSRNILSTNGIQIFWIPSGTNSFPGNWSIPTIVNIHDVGEFRFPRKYDIIRTLYRKLISTRLSLRRAAKVTAISECTASEVKELLNYGKSIEIIYLGISPREHYKIESDLSVLTTHGIDISQYDEGIMYYPSRTDFFGKGLDIIIRALSILKDTGYKPPHVIVSGPKGTGHETFINEIAQVGINDMISYVGRVSDSCVDALYRASKLVIFPSRYEGFGFPALEAMYHKKPLICSDSTSLPEVAGDGAYYFKSGDANDFARSIKDLLQNIPLQQKLVANGQERLKYFSWDRSINKLASLFTSVYNDHYKVNQE